MTNIEVELKKKIKLSKNDTLAFTGDLEDAINFMESSKPFGKSWKLKCTLTDEIRKSTQHSNVMVSVSNNDYSITKQMFVDGWEYK